MKTLARILACLILALAVVSTSTAQRVSTQKRGTSSPNTAIGSGPADNVNLFSGALTNRIKLGPEFSVGPNMALNFQVIGNSSIWDFKPVTCNPQGPYELPIPDDKYNAGHAWQLLPLGALEFKSPFWSFRSSDGGEHGLYFQLHHNYPATPETGVFYSTSSTYLRLRHFPIGSSECTTPGECALLEFPSGEKREFHPFTVKGEELWLPTRAADAFQNWISISYPADGSWIITDIHGRTHNVTFEGTAGDYERIDELRIAQFGGGQATYDFQYVQTAYERQGFVPALCSSESPTVTLHALDRIVQPDNSFYEMEYYTTDDDFDILSGGISSLRHPAGGETRWTYTRLIIASQIKEPSPGPDPAPLRAIQRAYGVKTKETATSVGGTADGTWTYTYFADFGLNAPNEDGVPCHRTTTITDPLGDDTRHYFTTTSAHRWSFALPFTRCATGAYLNVGPFLSTEAFEGSADSGTLLRSTHVLYESDGLIVGNGAETQEHNQRLTYTKTTYHDDGGVFAETTFSDFDGLGNFRTQTDAATLSAQDGRVTTTNFNPSRGTLTVDPELGHSTGSTLVLPTSTEPWILRTFDHQTITAAGATSTVESCFDATNGFLLRQRNLGGNAPADGDLLTVFDSEVIFLRSTGFVASESRYGGANQGAMDNDYTSLCDMTLPATPEYKTRHTYHAGALESSTAIDTCDDTAFLVLTDNTIDDATGMIAASRTAAGVETAFDYDGMGRMVAQKPQDDAWLTINFRLPTTTSPNLEAQVTRHSCANGVTGCSKANSLTWERTHFDGLSRPVTVRRQVPTATGLSDQLRTTTYNGLGHKSTQSSWGLTSAVTLFENYDSFGRVGKVTAQDGAITNYTYLGARHSTRHTRIRASSGVVDTFHTETRDRFGRLIKVCNGQATAFAGSCTGTETTYLYDVGSRVTRICQNKVGEACGQIRRFVFDNRGVLLQERHPEIGIDTSRTPETLIVDSDGLQEVETTADVGNDWIFYTHDSRGNILSRNLEGSTEFDLLYHHDAAGRPILVEEANNGSPRPLKEFFYGFANDGTNLKAGQLVLTRRHNWVDIQGPLAGPNPGALDAVISEAFVYTGAGGRASSRQMRYRFSSTSFAFTTSQTFDALGNVASITYPNCVHGQGECNTAAPSRTVSYSYTKGYITAVPGFVNDIDYQNAQTIHQIQHSNGVTYTYAIDPLTGLARPHQISTTAGWDTGVITYDGSGNISAIGSEQFRYDRRHRLVSGQATVGASRRTQTAAFDTYGNITSLTTNGSTRTTPTDATSNRLTAGTYDGAGNLIAYDYGSTRYEYRHDSAGMMAELRSDNDQTTIYLYNAADQRVATFHCTINSCAADNATEIWTLRGIDNQILRIYTHPIGDGWHWQQDYVYAAGRAVASITPEDTFGLHTDHLGSIRQITDSTGAQVALHSYYPFGEEATNPTQSEVSIKFTGHERDSNNGPGVLDYMRARYCSPVLGRFASPDPKRRTEASTTPQSYNRYLYADNNPTLNVDPDGRAIETGWDALNVATGVFSLGKNLVAGNYVGAILDVGGLVVDVAATAIPGVPGGAGTAIKASRLAKNKAVGDAFEKAVLKKLGLSKNTKHTDSFTQGVNFRIPDGLQDFKGKLTGTILEIKSGGISRYSEKQIADFVKHAKDRNLVPVLAITKGTKFPKSIQRLLDDDKLTIIRIDATIRIVR